MPTSRPPVRGFNEDLFLMPKLSHQIQISTGRGGRQGRNLDNNRMTYPTRRTAAARPAIAVGGAATSTVSHDCCWLVGSRLDFERLLVEWSSVFFDRLCA